MDNDCTLVLLLCRLEWSQLRYQCRKARGRASGRLQGVNNLHALGCARRRKIRHTGGSRASCASPTSTSARLRPTRTRALLRLQHGRRRRRARQVCRSDSTRTWKSRYAGWSGASCDIHIDECHTAALTCAGIYVGDERKSLADVNDESLSTLFRATIETTAENAGGDSATRNASVSDDAPIALTCGWYSQQCDCIQRRAPKCSQRPVAGPASAGAVS